MTTLGIILIVVAFGIGALITYLIMRAKQSVIREQSRLAANSISELQQRLEDSQQEISLLSEQQQKANIKMN